MTMKSWGVAFFSLGIVLALWGCSLVVRDQMTCDSDAAETFCPDGYRCDDGRCFRPTDPYAPGPNWPLPDTDQRSCFDAEAELGTCPSEAGSAACAETAFCGQDAQYGWDLDPESAERFSRSGLAEPIVTDSVTGLIWQGCSAGRSGEDCSGDTSTDFEWNEALEHCEQSEWGGFRDWHLPDRYELQSLVSYGRIDPSIHDDTNAFPNAPSVQFWSSSSFAGESSQAWSVSFWGGTFFIVDKAGELRRVRCVRSEPRHTDGDRFVRSEPVEDMPVVIDRATGLMWQGCALGLIGIDCTRGAAAGIQWQAALARCESLDWGGYDDWTLPNIIELTSIVDDRHIEPAIDTTVFPATPGMWFWSSTTDIDFPATAWVVQVSDGDVQGDEKAGDSPDDEYPGYHVRCVRR